MWKISIYNLYVSPVSHLLSIFLVRSFLSFPISCGFILTYFIFYLWLIFLCIRTYFRCWCYFLRLLRKIEGLTFWLIFHLLKRILYAINYLNRISSQSRQLECLVKHVILFVWAMIKERKKKPRHRLNMQVWYLLLLYNKFE